MRTRLIEGREVWTAEDLQRDRTWVVELTSPQQAEALAALARVDGEAPATIDIGDFPLPTLGPVLDRLIDEIEGGRGVALLRGVPIDDLQDASIERLFWGLSLHLGTPEAQDRAGRRLHHVRAERSFAGQADAKAAFNSSNMRGYQTNLELAFHGDGSDALLLLCIRDAPQGGMSRVASASGAFNRVLERRPDLAVALQQPFVFDTRGELGAERPFQVSPIFVEHAGRMNILYKRGYIQLAQRLPGAPRLTPEQVQAMDLLDEILLDPRLHYEFKLGPGDILIANNYNVLHARTPYVDDPDPVRARHMLRIWSTLRRSRRPLPPTFRESREFGASYRRRLALGDAA